MGNKYEYTGVSTSSSPSGKNKNTRRGPVEQARCILHTVYERVKGYAVFTILTVVGLFHFLYGMILLPVKVLSPTIFRHACSFVLSYSVPGFLCVPFSWCGTKLVINGLQFFEARRDENALFLANHNARIDWIIGLFMGSVVNQRVSFVTEAFIMILPIIGWFRYLVEDMFVFRSFKQDKDRMEKNIQAFHDSKCTRWVFLCPEGAIVDFSHADKQYVKDCNKFCQSMGLEPFEMVLTPRYKGLQCFNKIVTNGVDCDATDLSVTMTYTQNGEKLSKPLKDANRVIPDLWVILKGNLTCHVNVRELVLSNDPEVMKHQIMRDYAFKDRLLKHFWVHGEYPQEADAGLPESASSPYEEVPVPHTLQNASLFGQFALWGSVLGYFGVLYWAYYILVSFYIIIMVSHITGEILANGQSRESIPFEGLTKALLFRMIGREGAAKPESKPARVELNAVEPEPESQIPSRNVV
uniref:Phospholipid/glycerol acyltransferase domain-containing protein n=1 Tax=Aplanochytrium stocchinoi TaxID=215587 RepID=A0A7S3UYA3_9STRA|mmetsp:Transcript_7147/g.9043  ORF Transcript_7147/g.9043 Transcript_7147/m.9043 type:complete len:467 (-) Transcript_7147:131-1531(-)|eukprot:CAMPEP_0204832040 /NCGR_PEP_ID=MMETSP1346-20131115/12495_1 /ASSEMBLY_ACC=CAM_ASM_000771 /TAXON_ID=215587 /ORGANISM="Aplanochytrium stocchinoi, Strain GSBS06" /LENGTH=466 /DNA_ID=CAMNT_0051963579 /DNA_START=228 /DNA_END=1628 /DNA_ORIENTATION=+